MLNYTGLVNDILINGSVVESRLGPSREVIGRTVAFTPYDLVWRPKVNKALGWMELIQLIAGVFEPDEISRVAPSARMEYFTSMSAYGPRIYSSCPSPTKDMVKPEYYEILEFSKDIDYIQRVLRHLRDTPNTRKAVLFIGKSYDDVDDQLSCTLTYQFLSRDGKLHAVISMRSWDVIRGLPYDIVMFGGLLQAAAHVLKLNLGMVQVTAGSLHFYEADQELIPARRRMATYKLNFAKDAIWSGIRVVCKNQVHQRWEDTVKKAPHFIDVSEWRDISTEDLSS